MLKIANSSTTYIGIKIIKPDGTIQIVNPDEEVLDSNDAKNQQGKVAVPGLQIGDIIDYYISTSSITEDPEQINYDNNYFFYLTDEYPILNYQMGFQFNKKTHLYYMIANGAPEFVKTTNADGDQILNIELTNITKRKDNLWTSPARQYPYITIMGFYESKYNNAIMAVKNDKQDSNVSNLDKAVKRIKEGFDEVTRPVYYGSLTYANDYFGGIKAFKAAPLDSSMKVLYDAWKFDVFCSYSDKDFDVSENKYNKANLYGIP